MHDTLDQADSRAVASFFRGAADRVASLDEVADAIPDDVHVWNRTDHRLHRVTLPHMADDGILDYDPDATTVRYRGRRLHPKERGGKSLQDDEGP